MKRKRLVSIVIPAKDEEENIPLMLRRLKRVLAKLRSRYKFEITVVCDNCTDNTELAAKHLGVKTLRRTSSPGKSKALVDGFSQAKGEILVMMDADLSHLPEELPVMIDKLFSRPNIGLVVASRELGHSDDATPIRRLGGRLFNFCTNLLFHTQLSDAINGYKIFHRHIFDNYRHAYKAAGYAIEIELIANTLRSQLQVVEIPSYEAKRLKGVAKSKIIKDGWYFFSKIWSEGVKFRFEKARQLT